MRVFARQRKKAGSYPFRLDNAQKNGFDVLKLLKNNSETKDIPVIVLTNLAEVADIDKALELGATTYLVKGDHALIDICKNKSYFGR